MPKKSVFSNSTVQQYIKMTIENSPSKDIAFETIAGCMGISVETVKASYNGTGGYKKYPSPIYKNGLLFKPVIKTDPIIPVIEKVHKEPNVFVKFFKYFLNLLK